MAVQYELLLYPAAVLISALFLALTLATYLSLQDLRSNPLGRLTIGFLANAVSGNTREIYLLCII